MNVQNRVIPNPAANASAAPNNIAQKRTKGTLVRRLMVLALAEVIMGTAMANGVDVNGVDVTETPVAASIDVVDTDVESTDTTTAASSYAAADQLPSTIASHNPGSIGVREVSDPLIAIEGMRGTNLASLNGADPMFNTALAMGVNTNASGGNAVAFGLQALALSDNSVALGNNVTTGAGTPYSVAVGSDAQTTGTQAVALGAHVLANADNALAVGNNNTWALGASSIAQGDGAKVLRDADNSIAIGTTATVAVNVNDATALGANTRVTAGANGGVALGAGSIANRGNALSIGSAGAERQIINVGRGTQDTDAVNVSQLRGVTDTLGAGAGIAPDGSIIAPAFLVNGNRYSTVEQAIQAAASYGATDPFAVKYDLNADGTPNWGSITLGGTASAPVILTNVADGRNQYDAVNFGQLSGLQDQVNNLGDRVTNIENNGGGGGGGGGGDWNNDAGGEKIVNVADGAVDASSKDAVNGSQLHGTAKSTADALGGGSTVNADGTITKPTYTVGGQQVYGVEGAVNQLDRRIDNMQSQIDNTARGAYSGIAAATALTMIPGVDIGKTLSIGAGVADYKGHSAFAIGGEARINENWKVRGGMGLSGSGNTAGVGASFQW